jgi:hypothetical protein
MVAAKSNDIRVTVTRRSVMQVAPYESEEASSSVEFSMDGGASAEEVMGEQSAWSDRLATANYESLGIGYEITEVAVRRLQKSVPGGNESPAVAAAQPQPAGGQPTRGAQDDLWRDVMNNSSKWFTNWPEQLEGSENPKRPAYRRSADGKGLWLTRKDGSANFPNFFVCPKTGKTGDALTEVGNQISQKVSR